MKIEIQLSDLLYILVIFVTLIVTFISAKFSLREFVRNEVKALTERIHQLEIEVEKLKTFAGPQRHNVKRKRSQLIDHTKLKPKKK